MGHALVQLAEDPRRHGAREGGHGRRQRHHRGQQEDVLIHLDQEYLQDALHGGQGSKAEERRRRHPPIKRLIRGWIRGTYCPTPWARASACSTALGGTIIPCISKPDAQTTRPPARMPPLQPPPHPHYRQTHRHTHTVLHTVLHTHTHTLKHTVSWRQAALCKQPYFTDRVVFKTICHACILIIFYQRSLC